MASQDEKRFQSHAGSIEADQANAAPKVDSLFQSHAGSIEATHPTCSTPKVMICFNPTLVRLRLGRGYLRHAEYWTRFQSHAGSIEAGSSRLQLRISLMVSIPRWFD